MLLTSHSIDNCRWKQYSTSSDKSAYLAGRIKRMCLYVEKANIQLLILILLSFLSVHPVIFQRSHQKVSQPSRKERTGWMHCQQRQAKSKQVSNYGSGQQRSLSSATNGWETHVNWAGLATDGTRNSSDADKPRNAFRGQQVTKHGTIRYVRYGFLFVFYSSLVPKTFSFKRYSTWPWNPG